VNNDHNSGTISPVQDSKISSSDLQNAQLLQKQQQQLRSVPLLNNPPLISNEQLLNKPVNSVLPEKRAPSPPIALKSTAYAQLLLANQKYGSGSTSTGSPDNQLACSPINNQNGGSSTPPVQSNQQASLLPCPGPVPRIRGNSGSSTSSNNSTTSISKVPSNSNIVQPPLIPTNPVYPVQYGGSLPSNVAPTSRYQMGHPLYNQNQGYPPSIPPPPQHLMNSNMYNSGFNNQYMNDPSNNGLIPRMHNNQGGIIHNTNNNIPPMSMHQNPMMIHQHPPPPLGNMMPHHHIPPFNNGPMRGYHSGLPNQPLAHPQMPMGSHPMSTMSKEEFYSYKESLLKQQQKTSSQMRHSNDYSVPSKSYSSSIPTHHHRRRHRSNSRSYSRSYSRSSQSSSGYSRSTSRSPTNNNAKSSRQRSTSRRRGTSGHNNNRSGSKSTHRTTHSYNRDRNRDSNHRDYYRSSKKSKSRSRSRSRTDKYKSYKSDSKK
jgi:hypothetical protein